MQMHHLIRAFQVSTVNAVSSGISALILLQALHTAHRRLQPRSHNIKPFRTLAIAPSPLLFSLSIDGLMRHVPVIRVEPVQQRRVVGAWNSRDIGFYDWVFLGRHCGDSTRMERTQGEQEMTMTTAAMLMMRYDDEDVVDGEAYVAAFNAQPHPTHSPG
jgi:hypothetical protein